MEPKTPTTRALIELLRPGVGRGLDFVMLDELRKRTSITRRDIAKFAVSEMLCNSLDTDASNIYIEVKAVGNYDVVKVKDDGSKKISLEELKLILDFSNKASSKRGFLRVSRGYLGNALKCIFGYSYALAESKGYVPPEIVVNSHGTEYRITLKPNRVKELIEHEIETDEVGDEGFNAFTVKFPIDRSLTKDKLREDVDEPIAERDVLYDVIFASFMVNPTRRIVYSLWGEEGELGEPSEAPPLSRTTSILWYEPKQFTSLFNDFLKARPETQLKEFIPLFRGFTSKKVIREILQKLGRSSNHDHRDGGHVQFFPATRLQDLSKGEMEELYYVMRGLAKPVSKRSVAKVLGVVGEERFKRLKERQGWVNLKYSLMKGRKLTYPLYPLSGKAGCVGFPFLIELAVFDRKEEDEKGLKIFQCVNFMASMEDIFSRIFNIKYRLGRVGITPEMPVTVLVHLVCPVLKWLNYGKSGLYE